MIKLFKISSEYLRVSIISGSCISDEFWISTSEWTFLAQSYMSGNDTNRGLIMGRISYHD